MAATPAEYVVGKREWSCLKMAATPAEHVVERGYAVK
jgi:hypothetical protein